MAASLLKEKLLDLYRRLLDRFGPRATRVINLLTSIFAMIFTLVLLWQVSIMAWTAFKEKWTSPTMLNAPYAYIYVVMVFGSFMLFLTFFFRTLLQFKSGLIEDSK